MAVGGLGSVTHFSALEPTIFIEEILGFERNTYNLRNLCRVVQVPELHATVRLATRDTVDTKVEELQEPDLKRADYSTVDLALWKNVGMVAFSDESQKRGTGPLMQLEIEDTARDLGRAENVQIATEWANNSNATATGGIWTTDTNDPADDILPLVANMMAFDLGYETNNIAMHPLVYAAFVRNQMVSDKDTLRTQVVQTGRINSCYGLSITVDIGLANNVAYLLDKGAPACLLAEGGSSAARWRNEPAGYDAYIIRQWLEPKIVKTGSQCPIQSITGVR
jgi:HK97 family phage major capsid protein